MATTRTLIVQQQFQKHKESWLQWKCSGINSNLNLSNNNSAISVINDNNHNIGSMQGITAATSF